MSAVRVLSDHHHSSLWESLELLFTDRLGFELYRPRGAEWWEQGMWQFDRQMPHFEAVARQYMGEWSTDVDCGDHWERTDSMYPHRVHKMLTLEQARDLRPDIVMATISENEPGFHAFAREIGAKFGIQLGNQGSINHYHLADFSLISTTRDSYPWTPYVVYRQEFDLEHYRFEYPPSERDYIGSWVQALPAIEEDYGRFLALAHDLPELRFRYHGHVGPVDDFWGGNVTTSEELARQMRSAGVGLHFKRWSDGYGHVAHNLAAVGKPLVATASYYADKLFGPLLVEGVTSFDVQTHTHQETVDFIRRLTVDDELHERMSRAMATRFREIVNFDVEAEQIRSMLENVLSDRKVAA
jgi:hypothetical protein